MEPLKITELSANSNRSLLLRLAPLTEKTRRTGQARTLARALSLLVPGLLLAACAPEEEEPIDLGPPAPDLIMPDMTGLDMATQLNRGLALALSADLRQPWSAFVDVMALRDTCPDLYASGEGDNDMPPLYWSDSCKTAGGILFEGDQGWNATATRDVLSTSSYVDYGERLLDGTSTVESETTRLFAFSGEGSDSFYASIDDATQSTVPNRWTYSASVSGTVSGTLPFSEGSTYTGGWREDLYLNYTGGDADQLTMRGDLFLLQETFDRFDSVSLDMTLYGAKGAPPGTCLKEPYGYIGLRDTNAYWYEVIFMPMDETEAGAESPECDGCGTLFVRGVEQATPVCVSFDSVWETLSPPVINDYIYSVRL